MKWYDVCFAGLSILRGDADGSKEPTWEAVAILQARRGEGLDDGGS